MSEKLCTLRTKGGGGGKYTETSLWTNSAPTSSFAGQDVTLSESFDNYKYVKVRYKLSTTNNTEAALIVTSDDLKKSLGGDNQININFGGRTTTTRDRIIRYVNTTTLTFTVAYHLNGTTTSTSDLIPLEILGLNELDHGTALSTFEIMGISAGTSTFQISVNSSDSTLMDVNTGTGVQTSSFTVKRNAKGKVYFFFGNRSSVTQYGTITFKGTTYRPDSYSTSTQVGIDVEFSANDTISVTCGKSSANGIGMVFVEEK